MKTKLVLHSFLLDWLKLNFKLLDRLRLIISDELVVAVTNVVACSFLASSDLISHFEDTGRG